MIYETIPFWLGILMMLVGIVIGVAASINASRK